MLCMAVRCIIVLQGIHLGVLVPCCHVAIIYIGLVRFTAAYYYWSCYYYYYYGYFCYFIYLIGILILLQLLLLQGLEQQPVVVCTAATCR